MWGETSEQQAFAEIWPLWYEDLAVRDRHAAVKRLLPLADAGYAPAMFAVGWAYSIGDGVRRNYAKAFHYLTGAAEQQYPSAEGMVGTFYAAVKPKHGVCEHDPEKAVRWYRRAAVQGNSGAQYNLASSYWTGLGVERSAVEAYVWASLSVHCSHIRNRMGEVLRDQAVAELAPEEMAAAEERLARLRAELPQPWSDHSRYWRSLAQEAGIIAGVE